MATRYNKAEPPLVPNLATLSTMQDQLYYNVDDRVSTQENQFFFFIYMARIYEAMLRLPSIFAIVGDPLVNGELASLNSVSNPRASEVVLGLTPSNEDLIKSMHDNFSSFKSDQSEIKDIIVESQTRSSFASSLPEMRIGTATGDFVLEGIDWGHALFLGTLFYGKSSAPRYNKYKTVAFPSTRTGEIIAFFYANCQAYRIRSIVALARQECRLDKRLEMIAKFMQGEYRWHPIPGVEGTRLITEISELADDILYEGLPQNFASTPSDKLGTAVFTLFCGFEKKLPLASYLARVHGDGKIVSNINDFEPIQPLRPTDTVDILRWNQLPSPHLLREEGTSILESAFEIVELANPDKVVGDAALLVESTRTRINLIDRLLTMPLESVLIQCDKPEVQGVIDPASFKLAFILCVMRPYTGAFTYICAGARYLLKLHPSYHLRRLSILVLSVEEYGVCIPQFSSTDRDGVPRLHFYKLRTPEALLRISLILRRIYSEPNSDIYLLPEEFDQDDSSPDGDQC